MFGIDDLLFVGFVAVVAKTLHWMMNQPRHDDDSDSARWSSYRYDLPSYRTQNSFSSLYDREQNDDFSILGYTSRNQNTSPSYLNRELEDLIQSLNRIAEQSNNSIPDLSSYSSRRRRPRSDVVDRETGDFWEE